MAFIVETGSGVPGANAYASTSFVDTYLAERARAAENSWQSQAASRKQQAIVVASSYIDKRWGPRFKGSRARSIVDGREATGSLTLTALPLLNETATVGLVVYRFVDALTQANDVLRGATVASAVANLAAAINGGGDGITSHVNTVANYEAVATDGSPVLNLAAAVDGTSGNEITLATTITGASVSGARFAGGLDEGPQGLMFPRKGLLGYDGHAVVGVPWKLKAAAAEYAVRSLVGALDPDLTADASGALVQRKREVVGPIEEETEFAQGAQPRIYQDYPAADRLLHEYLRSAGGAVR